MTTSSSPFAALRRPSPPELAALLLAAGAFLSLAGPASAQIPITFGAAQTISADTDVLNVGTTFTATAFGNLSSTVTVNGVTFTGQSAGSRLTISGFPDSYPYFGSNQAPESSLSNDYRSLLSGGIYSVKAGGNVDALLISGLTAGNQYEAQFFVSDPRTYGAGRIETLSGGTSLVFNSTGQEGGVGQFADSHVFTADASGTATFSVTAGGPDLVSQVNAFQVRDLGTPAAVPEASTTVSLGALLALGGLGLMVQRRRMVAGK